MKIKELKNYFKKLFLPCRNNDYHPNILKGKFLFWYAILLIVLKAVMIPFYLYFPKNVFFAEISQSVLIDLTNRARETAGIAPLQPNSVLQQAAFMKAQDMLSKNYFSHQSPDGLSPWYWFSKTGYQYQFAGENLAVGFLDSEEVYSAWMNSPSHRNNILNPKYREIGIAVVRGKFQEGNEANIVVQLFGAPKTSIVASEEITSVQKKQSNQDQAVSVSSNLQNTTTESMVLSQELSEVKLSPSASIVGSSADEKRFKFNKSVFYFLSVPYQKVLDKIIYTTLIFVFSSLVITFFVDIFWYRAFSIQHKDIVLKTFIFGLLLTGLLVTDKMKLLSLLPPDIYIY